MLYPLIFITLLFFTILFASTQRTRVDEYYYWSFDPCFLLERNPFLLLTHTHTNDFTSKTYIKTLETCHRSPFFTSYKTKYRPIIGDHIHLGYTVRINNQDITLRDRNLTEPVPYENHPPSCPNPPEYAYIKQYYHTGVHTHCDGIIHIHPWSAPKELRKEGRDITLGLWFENVGISVSSMGYGIRIPGYEYMDLKLLFYLNVNDSEPLFTITDVDEIKNLWLVDHHAGIVLWDGIGKMPRVSQKVLEYKSHPLKYPTRYN